MKENNLGWAFDWTQSDAMSHFLSRLSINHLDDIQKKGQIAYNFVGNHYSRQIQMKKYDDLFEKAK